MHRLPVPAIIPLLLLACVLDVGAQDSAPPSGSGEEEVRAVVRAFYFHASDHGPRVDHAVVTLEGKWALARVPACVEGSGGMDEFRLLRVQERWRIVYIAMAPR